MKMRAGFAVGVIVGLMLLQGGRARAADGGSLKNYAEQIPGTALRFDMIAVPGGEFVMGSPANEVGRKADEGPQVRVRMEPFYIAKFVVTWPEFLEFTGGYHRLQQMGKPIV